MHKYPQIVSVIAVLHYHGKYLLVQRSQSDEIFPNKWQNVGGKVEPGETIENALCREIKEELGITLNNETQPIFLQSYAWKKSDNEPIRLGIIFLITLATRPEEITISEELSNYDWFTFEETLSLDTISKDSSTGTLSQLKKAQILLLHS